MAEEEVPEGPDGASSNDESDWMLWEAERQAGETPAHYVDRLYVKPLGSMLRISFGEQMGDQIVYRHSFVVPAAVALEMGDLLDRMGTAALEAQISGWRKWVAENPTEAPQSDG